MDGTRVTNFGTAVSKKQVCVIYVDFKNFMGGAKTFSDIETTQCESLPLNPASVLRALRTLQVITFNSNLGTQLTAKQIKYLANGGADTSGAVAGANGGGNEGEDQALYDCGTQKCFIETPDGLLPKIVQQIVTLRGEHGEILGWLIFYISRDEQFDFDLAFLNYCLIEKERMSKRTHRQTAAAAAVTSAAAAAATSSGAPPVDPAIAALKPYIAVKPWLKDFAFYYWGANVSNKLTYKAFGLDLNDVNNPFNFHKLFCIERALFWHNMIHQRNRQKIEYFSFSGYTAVNDHGMSVAGSDEAVENTNAMDALPEPSEKFTIVYPEEAYEVPFEKAEPSAFFGIEIEELYADNQDGADDEDPYGWNDIGDADGGECSQFSMASQPGDSRSIDAAIARRQKRDKLGKETKAQSQFDGLKRLIESKWAAELEARERSRKRQARQKQPTSDTDSDTESIPDFMRDSDSDASPGNNDEPIESTTGWCKGPDGERLFQSVMRTDADCPASRAAYDWYLTKPRDVSFVTPVTDDLCDEQLTFFGNMLARDMLKIEEDLGIIHLHVELILMSTSTLMIPDIDADCDVMMHILVSGPPACGKSNLQKQLMGMMIPKTYMQLAVQSKMSMTVKEVFSGLLIIYDEAPDNFKDESENGAISQMKTVMTSGILQVQHCHINPDTGERHVVYTESKRKCMFLLNTNDRERAFPEAIVSRTAILWTPKRNRPGRDEVREQFVFDTIPEKKASRDKFREECRIRQFMAICIHLWIRLGAIPRINTLIPSILIPKIKNIVASAGYILDPRMNFRLMIAVKNLCIYDAINRVFFTEKHFARGTPFRFSHVLECAQYLVCRREHVWAALGMMMPSMVKPYVDDVLEAMYELVHNQVGDDKFSRHRGVAGTMTVPEPDYDYYIVDTCDHMPDRNSSVLNEVSAMVETHMESHSVDRLSKGNIRDVLDWLKDSGHVTSHYKYNSANSWTRRQTPISLPKIKIKDFGRPRGICILREWIETITDEKGKLRLDCSMHGLLLRCIEGTMTDEYRNTDFKYITGHTLRSEYKPYVFEVFCASDYAKRMKICKEIHVKKQVIGFGGGEVGEAAYKKDCAKMADAAQTAADLMSEELEMALFTETGKTHWSLDSRKLMYSIRVNDQREDEDDATYIARVWNEREHRQAIEREKFIRNKLSAYDDVQLSKLYIETGREAYGGGCLRADGSRMSDEELCARGERLKREAILKEWYASEALLEEADIRKLGEAIVTASRKIDEIDDQVDVDEDVEAYFKSVCGITWFKDTTVKSARQAVQKRIREFNKDNLSLDELAQQKWRERLGIEEKVDFGLPEGCVFHFCNYPHSVVPRDFLTRCDVVRLLKAERERDVPLAPKQRKRKSVHIESVDSDSGDSAKGKKGKLHSNSKGNKGKTKGHRRTLVTTENDSMSGNSAQALEDDQQEHDVNMMEEEEEEDDEEAVLARAYNKGKTRMNYGAMEAGDDSDNSQGEHRQLSDEEQARLDKKQRKKERKEQKRREKKIKKTMKKKKRLAPTVIGAYDDNEDEEQAYEDAINSRLQEEYEEDEEEIDEEENVSVTNRSATTTTTTTAARDALALSSTNKKQAKRMRVTEVIE